jgi:hypothetical protein
MAESYHTTARLGADLTRVEDSMFALEPSIGGGRSNVPRGQNKEGKGMAPLYTVLLCVPAVLALFIAVGGLVLLRSRRQGTHRPTQASERRT